MRSKEDNFDFFGRPGRKDGFGSGGGGSSPSNDRRRALVDEFCAATGASVAVAEEKLSRHAGNLASAIEEYLKGGGGSSRNKKPGYLEQRRRCEQVQAILDIPERKAMELLDSVYWDVEGAIAAGQDGRGGSSSRRKGRSVDARARSGSASRRNQFDSESDSEPDDFTAMKHRSRSQPDGIGQSNGGFGSWPPSHGGNSFDDNNWGAPPSNSTPWGSAGGGFSSPTSRDRKQKGASNMGGFGASGFGGMDANSPGYGGGCGSQHGFGELWRSHRWMW